MSCIFPELLFTLRRFMKTSFCRSSTYSIIIMSFLWIVGVLLGLFAANSRIGSLSFVLAPVSVGSVLLGLLITFIVPIVTVVILGQFKLFFPLYVLCFIRSFLSGFSLLILLYSNTGMRGFISATLAPNCCSILMLWFSYCTLLSKTRFQNSLMITMGFPILFICIIDLLFILL